MSKPKGKRSREVEDINLLAFQVRRQANELSIIAEKLKVAAIIPEDYSILLGELRAVRHLLDTKGKFAHLDRLTARASAKGK